MEEDRKIASLILKGKTEYYELIVRKYSARLCKFMQKSGLPKEDAEDLTQEVLIKAYNKLYSYDSRWEFSTWIFKIAVNTCKDFHKKRKIKITQTDRSDFADYRTKYGSDDEICCKEAVRELFNTLKQKDRTIMILHYFYGFTHREIGQISSMTEAAVKMRIYRIRNLLSDMFRDKYTGGELM